MVFATYISNIFRLLSVKFIYCLADIRRDLFYLFDYITRRSKKLRFVRKKKQFGDKFPNIAIRLLCWKKINASLWAVPVYREAIGDRGGSGKSRVEPGTVLGTTLRSMQQPMRRISWAASLCLPLPVDNYDANLSHSWHVTIKSVIWTSVIWSKSGYLQMFS